MYIARASFIKIHVHMRKGSVKNPKIRESNAIQSRLFKKNTGSALDRLGQA